MNGRPYEQASQIGTRPAPWLRLLAFWFDVTLVAAPVKLVLFLLDAERYMGFTLSLYGLGPSLLTVVTSLPLMALTTSRWGTTAGKRLLGCTVRPAEGESSIGFTRAYKRSLTSYAVGAGMTIFPEVTALSLFFCYRGLKYRGITFWDAVFRTRVEHTPVRPAMAAVFASALLLLRLVDAIPMFILMYLPYLEQFWEVYQSLSAAVRIIVS